MLLQIIFYRLYHLITRNQLGEYKVPLLTSLIPIALASKESRKKFHKKAVLLQLSPPFLISLPTSITYSIIYSLFCYTGKVYSVIVDLTGLLIGYSVIVALKALSIEYSS